MPSVRTLGKRAPTRQYRRQPTGRSYPFPAPSMGMNTRDSVSTLDPREGRLIENMIAESGKLVIRKGKALHQTVGSGSAIGSIFTHEGVSSNVLLVATDGEIYDATGSPSALTSNSYNSNNWSIAQFNDTSVGVNGQDTPWSFDGSSVSASGLSGSGLTISNLRTVHVVGIRMWFTEVNSADVWYLAPNAITGTLTKFQLSEETKGGYCVGVYGFRNYTVFVMSTGEIVAYQGDPGSDFAQVATYESPVPVGYDPGVDVSGEPVIMTASGPLPFEAIAAGIGFDSTALQSWGKIAPSWAEDFESHGSNTAWNATFHKGLVIFNIPTSASTSKQWIFNTRTRAWSIWTGLEASQFSEVDGTLYYGDLGQNAVFAYMGGTDEDGFITAVVRGAYAYPFENRVNGQYTLGQLVCTASGEVTAQLQVDVDFKDSGIDAPDYAIASAGSGPWDGPWDGPWGEDGEALLRWVKIRGYGRAVAPVVKFNSKADDLKFFATNIIAAPAGVL